MKKLNEVLLLSAISIIFLFSNQSFCDEKKEDNYLKIKTIVYYFHSNIRCETCNTLEDFTKDAVMKYFSKEIEETSVELKITNIDEKNNEQYINKYDLYMQTVILLKIVNGKEIKFKTLDTIWDLVEDKEKYYLYIEQEIKEFMK